MTFVSSSHGLKSFWYTWLPYAVTIKDAVTFCTSALVPPTSNVICFVERSNWMLRAVTVISALSTQVVKPDVCRMSPASAILESTPRIMVLTTHLREVGRDLILANCRPPPHDCHQSMYGPSCLQSKCDSKRGSCAARGANNSRADKGMEKVYESNMCSKDRWYVRYFDVSIGRLELQRLWVNQSVLSGENWSRESKGSSE